MTDGDGNSGFTQPVHVGGIGRYPSLHGIAQCMQDLGDATCRCRRCRRNACVPMVSGNALMTVPPARFARARRRAPLVQPHRQCRGRRRPRHQARERAAPASAAGSANSELNVPQSGGEKPDWRNDPGAAGVGQSLGVGALMIVDGTWQRHQYRPAVRRPRVRRRSMRRRARSPDGACATDRRCRRKTAPARPVISPAA